MFKLSNKGGKVNLDVRVDHPQQAYFRGDTVHATVTVSTDQALPVQEGRLALVCVEEFIYDERAYRANPKRGRTAPETREFDYFTFMEGVSLPTGAPQTFAHDFTIPADAMPTFQASAIQVHWFVKATLRPHEGSEVSAEAELGVALAPPQQTSNPGEFGKGSMAEAEMSIWLPKAEWLLGEKVEGKLLVKPTKNFDANMLVVALKLVEEIALPNIKTHNDNKGDFRPVAMGAKLVAGQTLEYPFALMLPGSPQPSFDGAHSAAKWYIHVTCIARHQLEFDAPIQVYGALR